MMDAGMSAAKLALFKGYERKPFTRKLVLSLSIMNVSCVDLRSLNRSTKSIYLVRSKTSRAFLNDYGPFDSPNKK